MGRDTFQLFTSLPSFGEGMARVLDIRGQMIDVGYIVSDTPEAADARAIASDWDAVLHDLNSAAIVVTSKKNGAETAVSR